MGASFQLTVIPPTELTRQGLQNLGADIPKIGRMGIYRTMQRISKRLKKPGAPIFYPVNWDTPLQRRAFFATDGFGRGIPTGRSGEYQEGFQIVGLPDGYQLVNHAPGAGYIGGDFEGQGQSRIHMERWPLIFEIANEELDKLPDDVLAELRLGAANYGFDMSAGEIAAEGFE
jgi:hypothetical protein